MHEATHRQNDLTSILIKPAGPDCNLTCTYCFYRKTAAFFDENAPRRMSDTVLEAMTRQMMALPSRHLSLGWQGGEPTLMGLDFFERAIDLQIQYGRAKIVGNSLQTNGLLIDDAWARFLARYNFLVGLSIDGPASLHDPYRTAGGHSSWQSGVAAAKRLREHGVMVNALTVVTDRTALHPEAIYTTLKSLGITHQQYIPCVEPNPASGAPPAPFSVTPEAFGAFLVALFDLWMADFEDGVPTTMIRLFDALLAKALGGGPSDCTLLEHCGVYLVVEHNGDVFPCDFFVQPAHRLGNLLETPLDALFGSKKRVAFGAAKGALPPACLSCPWRRHCQGGCPKERPIVAGAPGPSYFCESYKAFFTHATPRLEAVARRFEHRAAADTRRTETTTGSDRARHVGRNALCPCGSGRKFKRCCGR